MTKRLTTLLEQSENMIDQDNPELVISVGEMALPFTFHLYNHKLDQVQFLGVHTGHLGFTRTGEIMNGRTSRVIMQ